MTRLDHNRAIAQLAAKARRAGQRRHEDDDLGQPLDHPVPRPVPLRGRRQERLRGSSATTTGSTATFIPTVAKRGAAIIEARGASSAASAANAAVDHVRVVGRSARPRATGCRWRSRATAATACPRGSSRAFPCTCKDGAYEIVQGLDRRRRRSSTRRSRRDIPWIRLNQYSLVQLGQGVHAKRIRATMTSATSRDRRRHRLRQGPHHPAARRRRPAGAQAGVGPHRGRRRVAAAKRIGYPVVVKPLDGNHGRGVCLNLQDEDDVREAFPIAEEQSRRGDVIVESFVTGKDYRCLIIDGRIAAIAERVPAPRDRRRHVAPSSSWSTSPTPTRAAASATRRC